MRLSDEVQRELLARSDLKAKRKGERVLFRCLRHDDKTPSAWTGGGSHGCFACGFEEPIQTLAEALGIALKGDGEYTLGDYADAKGFCVQTLTEWGLTTSTERGKSVVRIPYYDEGCNELRARFRSRTGQWWEGKNLPIHLYGRERLVDAKAGDRVLIVEGESDCHALWSSGVLAVGVPGCATWKPEWAQYLDGLDVYVWEEPDQGGAQLVERMRASYPDIRIVSSDAAKDPCELRQKNGTDFAATIHALMDEARPSSASEPDMPTFMSLTDLKENPELLAPPEAIVPHLAYRGRLVILAGPDKSGKSTLMGHAASALSRGHWFLGERCAPGRVLLLGLEEATGDGVRRLVELDAAADSVHMCTVPTEDILQLADEHLTQWPADLVIVDSLQEYARVTLGAAPGDGDNAGWASVVRPLVALARKHNAAFVLLHHTRRSDGKYRGAGEIAAAADAILEIAMPTGEQDPVTRHIKGRGRWQVDPFTVALRDGHYELSGGAALSHDARVLIHVESNPGASKNSVRGAIQARASAVDGAVNRLILQGAIEDRGQGGRMSLFTPSNQPSLEVLQ